MSDMSTTDDSSSLAVMSTDTPVEGDEDHTAVNVDTVITPQLTAAVAVAVQPVSAVAVERQRCREKVAPDTDEISLDVEKTTSKEFMLSPTTKVEFQFMSLCLVK